MSEIKRGLASVAGWLTRPAALFALCGVLLSPQLAQAQDALPFAKSYTVTGNYAVDGVDVRSLSQVNGFVTGTIPMSGVPANADILAAFLYWETISTNIAQLDGAQFRGSPLTVVKTSQRQLSAATAGCWSPAAPVAGVSRARIREKCMQRSMPGCAVRIGGEIRSTRGH